MVDKEIINKKIDMCFYLRKDLEKNCKELQKYNDDNWSDEKQGEFDNLIDTRTRLRIWLYEKKEEIIRLIQDI